ncbi:MAG: ATP-dependent DNA helicase [Bacteriovoracaceae bacterium]
MKIVKLALRDFALPAPRTGSIEYSGGYKDSLQMGQEIHQEIQEGRKEDFPNYQAEKKITHSFEYEGYIFQVEGRIDGIFTGENPHIEEIKTSFNLWDLMTSMKEKGLNHPYNLQLSTYGYFYFLKHGQVPKLSFHLVSLRDHKTHDHIIPFEKKVYEIWLKRRLSSLVKEQKLKEKREKRRKKLSRNLLFPFVNPRKGQLELVSFIEQGMSNNRPMMIQAPTGLGKTMGVLFPVLKEALSRGERVIYVTPKNSQHSVAEDALEKFEQLGNPIKSLTLTAKSKMCCKEEVLCNPEYCEFARNYYDKIEENKIKEIVLKKRKLTAQTFKKIGKAFEVCPFELQKEVLDEVDTLICDYNYVFSGNSLEFLDQNNKNKSNLVVDEAHNLPSRAMAYFSPELSSNALESMRQELKALPSKFAKDGENCLEDCLRVIRRHDPKNNNPHAKIQLKIELFLETEEKLRTFLTNYLESDVQIKAKDVVLRLYYYWKEFSEGAELVSSMDELPFFTTFHAANSGSIKITCCDAGKMLSSAYLKFDQVVAFSATLKPFSYYAKLSGLDDELLLTSEFKSPFDEEKRKVLIIPQISTKYSDREKNYSKIADVIIKVSSAKKGNYLAFFPSFDFLEKVEKNLIIPDGFRLVKQERSMKSQRIEEILYDLSEDSSSTILLAVQGGVFSEGVDYKGKMAIGAFVVGPPLPVFDVEREGMKEYYQENYLEGFDYAYTYPAMAKAIQSAGRVIRSEEDQGVIILMDGRFLEKSYTKTMPEDWFKVNAHELVSKSILSDLEKFWENK